MAPGPVRSSPKDPHEPQARNTPFRPAPPSTVIERTLQRLGYLVSHLLFIGAHTPEAAARRLRFTYRLAGVRIVERVTDEDVHRTVFLCPYRNLAAALRGKRWVCHQKLDRVDDGYAAYLEKKRGILYRRPEACPGSERCFSEVSRCRIQSME